ncbi:MAG TPA: protein kinase [Polyangiaceae bacterium]|nr:protein kinase [Polyangiaceae bacterium]
MHQTGSNTVVLGRYRIVGPLARGGMGVIYLARTEGAAGFARAVVVKSVLPHLMGDPDAARAFAREARILSNLQHPGIVNILDFGEENGAYVMVLEYVHGFNLGQWHRYLRDVSRPMPVEYAVHIVTRVLDALHYAHTFARADGSSMQIVHRDVSPGNILLDTQGNIKLLDFGIARAAEADEYRTRDGAFKGKFSYSAPEIYTGGPITPRSDAYSAAVVLYQILAGKNPFHGKEMAEIVRRVLMDAPGPLAPQRNDVPPALDTILARALSKDPEERYPSAAALADALRMVLPRKEHEFFGEFVASIQRDFNGDLPRALRIEALQARDLAWRSAPGDNADLPILALHSTVPPLQPRDSEKLTIAEPRAAQKPRPEAATSLLEGPLDPSVSSKAGRPRSNRTLWIALIAVTIVAVIGFAVVLRNRPSASAERTRFVYVEKNPSPAPPNSQVPATPPAANAPSTAEPSPDPATAAGAVSTPPRNLAPARPQSQTDAAALSRVFQKKRGRIEGCFSQHVSELAGRPQVSVRFQVAKSGRVESATLAPSALNGTPLGQCLLGIARATDFGAQDGPVTFTIPLTARRVE